MTEYLVVADKPTAVLKSRDEAKRRGCGPVTLYWWCIVEHPVTKAGAIVVETADDKVALTAQEATAVATRATLDSAGWFPKVDPALASPVDVQEPAGSVVG